VSNFNNGSNVMLLGTTIVDIRNGAQTATPFTRPPPQPKGSALHWGNSVISSSSATSRLWGPPGSGRADRTRQQGQSG
jgi:hypothetical protein